MKTIQLTQGLEAIVDESDYEYLNQFKWHAVKNRNCVYAKRDSRGKHISMHWDIMRYMPMLHADHINGNGLDNRRKNLRLATIAQNAMNRGVQKNNKLGVKGVFLVKSGKYRAMIKKNGKNISLGYFSTLKEASDAYNSAAQSLFGPYNPARNFPVRSI